MIFSLNVPNRMIKIAFIRQRWNPFGGAERFLQRAIETLSSRHEIEVTLICRQWRKDPKQQERTKVIPCNPWYLSRLWRDWSFSLRARALMKEGAFDLVQSHERVPGCDVFRAGDGVHATWVELRQKNAHWLQKFALSYSPWNALICYLEKQMFHHPNLKGVICNSNMVKNDIVSRFHLADEQVHVIHNGVDTDKFNLSLQETYRIPFRTTQGLNEAHTVILYVGSGYSRKGVPQLLEAFAQTHRPNDVLWIVGKDKQQKRMEALASTLGVANSVRFFGAQENVLPFYGAADYFALPTLYDPFPNVVLEALASGLPSLVSDTCGAAEIISPNENGVVCDASNSFSVAESLAKLLRLDTSHNRRHQVSSSISNLSKEKMGEALVNFYAEILKKKHGHR